MTSVRAWVSLGMCWATARLRCAGASASAYEGTLYNPLSNTRWNPPYFSLDDAANTLGGGSSNIVYGPVAGGTPRFVGPSPPGQYAEAGAVGNISGWDPSNPHLARTNLHCFPRRVFEILTWRTGFWACNGRSDLGSRWKSTTWVQPVTSCCAAESVNRVPGGSLTGGSLRTRHVRPTAVQPDHRQQPHWSVESQLRQLAGVGECRKLHLQRPASLTETATEPRPAIRRQLHLEPFHRFRIQLAQ